MKLCNTVYGMSANDGKVSHLNLSVINDSHFGDFMLSILRILTMDILTEAAVDLLNDLIDTWKKL